MKQIEQDRGPQATVLEQFGHVEAKHRIGEIEPVVVVVEQPRMLAASDPGIKARGQIARLRAAATGKQVANEAQTPQVRAVGEHLVDRLGDRRFLVGSIDLEKTGEPVANEGAVDRRIGQAQRIEARWCAAADPLVAPPDRAKENLGSTVLVEQDRAGRELLGLRGEEVEHHRLARARRPDDREIAEIAFVEVEEERSRAGRLEHGHRLAPVIVVGAPHRKAVKRDQPGGVCTGDQGAAHDIMFVAGKLTPEGGLEVDVLPNCDGTDVG